ncbi:MAG: hypothetical protein Q8Q13_03060, partial [bacterium]|nr:hypothetical protein [bacterium]
MWEQFWAQNIDYVIQVFIAFWMITACWIYLDGWFLDRQIKTFARAGGFFMLTIWAFLEAVPTVVLAAEQLVLVERFVGFAGLLGFGLVLGSLLVDPIPVKPNEKPIHFFEKLAEIERALAIRLAAFFKKIFTKTSPPEKGAPPPLSDEIRQTIAHARAQHAGGPQKTNGLPAALAAQAGGFFANIRAQISATVAKIKTKTRANPPPGGAL